MRKKILGATFAIAIMAVAGYNTYVSQTKKSMSDLALANVEALAADGEGGTPCPNPYDVYGFSLKFNPRQGVFSVDIEGYSTIANKKIKVWDLGISGNATVTYEIADCSNPAEGNCCPASRIGEVKIIGYTFND